MGYKYHIKHKKNGYTFRLLPPNSNSFEIGISDNYSTLEECKTALEAFRNAGTLLRSNPDLCKTECRDSLYYFTFYYNNDNSIFYRRHGYCQKTGLDKGIKCVIENINAPLKRITD